MVHLCRNTLIEGGDTSMNNNIKYYNCFSIGQMKYLRENGMEPIRASIHHSTKNTKWVFLMNENLSMLLKEWTSRK